MEYPKPLMTTTELVKMGFTRAMLYEMAHTPGQQYCIRRGSSQRGHFLFDTKLLEKARLKRLAR